MSPSPDPPGSPAARCIGAIPVRNLWLLMLYAAGVVRTRGVQRAATDADIGHVPDLIARLLTQALGPSPSSRLLPPGYRPREAVLPRVRGRIQVLRTESRGLLRRGAVQCAYEDLTFDTPRHRLLRAALEHLAPLVSEEGLRRQCRALAAGLARAGVGGQRPSPEALAADPSPSSRSGAAGQPLITLARLAFDLALPAEEAGTAMLPAPDREEAWVRRLFEKAVLGFARAELIPQGLRVRGGVPLCWPLAAASAGVEAILPRMVTDILIEAPDGSRLIIDTKFTAILKSGRFGNAGIASAHLYQLYAYLRSQEGRSQEGRAEEGGAAQGRPQADPRDPGFPPSVNPTAGLLLHPSVGLTVREHALIQGHRAAFATVDLAASPAAIRHELRAILMDALGSGTPPKHQRSPT